MTTESHRLPLAYLAVALAAGLAMASLGTSLVDPSAAAETLYLAAWATFVLLAIAGLGTEIEVGIAAVLSTLIVWAVPAGPTRGAALGLVLVLSLFLSLARRLAGDHDRLSWQTAIAATLGIQALCRADRFLSLEFDLRTLVGLILLPLVAATALVLLQRYYPARSVVLAGMVAALLVPGLSVVATLAIGALAIGTLWREHAEPAWLVMILAIGTVVAAFFWQPPLAGLIAATILAMRLPEGLKTYLGLMALAAILCLLYPPVRNWSEVLNLAALGPLLMPALLVPVGRRRSYAICGAILGLLALRTVAGPAALAAPLAIAALSLRFRGTVARVQSVWTASLLLGSTLLAAYPWLRADPLMDTLALVGVGVGWWMAVAIVGVTWALTLISAPFERAEGERSMAPWVVGAAVLFLALWIRIPSNGSQPFEGRIQVVDSLNAELAIDLADEPEVTEVVVDSYLENSAGLPVGVTVATVELVDSAGGIHEWPIRAGLESGEWAARRADVASLEGFSAPNPWISWVTPGGDLFAQRYRAVWSLPIAIDVRRLTIRRQAELDDGVSMAIFHLELRR